MTADIGYYVDSIGSPSQTKCLPGKYNPDQGATSVDACLDAEPGFYVQTTTSGAGSQTPCSAGTYQPAFGMTECTEAEKGYYVDTTQATTSTPCEAGTYQPNTGQVLSLIHI